MTDFEAARIVEALRTGVSSRAVGACFASARPRLLGELSRILDRIRETHKPEGLALLGKYGEGKTHMLNTLFNMAHERGMVVSLTSLSKETPLNKLDWFYAKLMQNTYLPGRVQPSFAAVLEGLTPGHPAVTAMQEYALRDLETKKLYYVFKSYLGAENEEEKFLLLADLQGDFIAGSALKQIYRRVYGETARDSAFNKAKHIGDYFAFMSRLFLKLGYQGWVILADEAELMGRLSRKARLKAYVNMAPFLLPEANSRHSGMFTVFAFNSAFVPDVIQGKNEYDGLAEIGLLPEAVSAVGRVLDAISDAPQLTPLSEAEILETLDSIRLLHGKAYGWNPPVTREGPFVSGRQGGLLRTRIRAAVEWLDQLYQYKDAGEIRISALDEADIKSEDIPSLEPLLDGGLESEYSQ